MESLINTAQTILTGYDLSLQRHIRSEERVWRGEDLAHRDHERELLTQESQFMHEERRFLEVQIQQAHLDNARALWQRFVNRNRTEVMEKTEQLKAVSSLSAFLAGFALVSFLEFQFVVGANYKSFLLPLFALTTSLTVGVEVAAAVLCSLMLANILRTAKTYVSEQEEAEFMHRCRVFVTNYRPGDRPPAPTRTFAAHWARRCEGEWRTAFRLFSTGIPCFFMNLALAGWIKFHDATTPTSPSLVTAVMGLALLYNLYTHRKWGDYLMQDGDEGQLAHHRLAQPAVGLPFDWHLPPLAPGGLAPQMHNPPEILRPGGESAVRSAATYVQMEPPISHFAVVTGHAAVAPIGRMAAYGDAQDVVASSEGGWQANSSSGTPSVGGGEVALASASATLSNRVAGC